MDSFIFYLFASLAITGALLLIAFRNPVSSALSMVLSFVGFAGLFISLNAYFIGIIQILVYAGAIMVLFLFIIMLLDLKEDRAFSFRPALTVLILLIPLFFIIQLIAVVLSEPNTPLPSLNLSEQATHFEQDEKSTVISEKLRANRLPDVHLIGHSLFGKSQVGEIHRGYNFPLQIAGLILLVSSVGVVILSARQKTS